MDFYPNKYGDCIYLFITSDKGVCAVQVLLVKVQNWYTILHEDIQFNYIYSLLQRMYAYKEKKKQTLIYDVFLCWVLIPSMMLQGWSVQSRCNFCSKTI